MEKNPKSVNEILSLNKNDGGRRLFDIELRDKTIKMDWIKRLHIMGDETFTNLAYYHLNTKIKNEIFWECNFTKKDCTEFQCKNRFWCNVIETWSEYNYYTPSSKEEIANQVIWYNTFIKIEHRMIFMQTLYDVGIIYIKDLFFNGQLMNLTQLCECYNVPLSTMQYNSLIFAIPNTWLKALRNIDKELEFQAKYGEMCGKKKWSNTIYTALNSNENHKGRLSLVWSNKLESYVDSENITKACLNINKATSIVKYRSFQYRLLHGVIFLNDRLVHMGITENNICCNCAKAKETVTHFFVECEHVRKIWIYSSIKQTKIQ